MTVSKPLKKTAGVILSIFLFLFIVLVAHIATAKPVEVKYDNASLQISRIDFDTPLDHEKVREIRRNLKSIPGVKNDHFNAEKGVVVFFHDNRIVNSEQVYNELMSKGDYKAKRFVLPPSLAGKKVCPVMEQDGFAYKFSRGIQRIFN